MDTFFNDADAMRLMCKSVCVCVACCHTESESIYLLDRDGFSAISILLNTLKNTVARSDIHLFQRAYILFLQNVRIQVKFDNIRF